MNGIENIIKRISDDAELEAKKIVADAENEALKIAEDFEKKISAMSEKNLDSANKKAEEEISRLVGGYRLEEKKKTLAKKQELISLAFDAAYDKLISLSDDERADVICALAKKASGGKEGEIILAAEDFDKLFDKVSSRLSQNANIRVSNERADISGGLIFRSGATEINCSFRALVDELRDGMSREIADILFG